MTRLGAQTLLHRPLAHVEAKEPFDLLVDLYEAHRTLRPSQNHQDRPTHRAELELPVTRPITTFPLRTDDL
jgi:hypothetical protein